MTTVDQQIKKGCIVESKRLNCQGVVRRIMTNIWADNAVSIDETTSWLESQTPPITPEQAGLERWFEVSEFSYMGFTSFESDLRIIQPENIKFSEFPSALYARIIRVAPKPEGLLLQVETDLPYTASRPSFLLIENATVQPYVGDIVYGTQDIVVVRADGLDYPYTLSGNRLKQDW